MSESERTKRRKIREEINILQSVYSHSSSRHDIGTNNTISTMDQIEQQLETNCIPCSNEVQIGEPRILFSQLSYDHSNVATKPNQSTSLISSIIPRPVTPSHFSDNTLNYSIQNFLARWAVQYNVPHNAVNGLLKGLKKHDCFNNLPLDC